MKTYLLRIQLVIHMSIMTCRVFGQTWTPTSAPATYWGSVVCSSDGAKLVAFSGANKVFISTDSGVSWVSNNLPVSCSSAACSSNCSTIIMGTVSDVFYASTNSGATWFSNNVPATDWPAVWASADGTKLVALGMENFFYTSTNSATSWLSNSTPPGLLWTGMACSADATKMAIAGVWVSNENFGAIYISTNSGATWQTTTAPSTNWSSIACSADGTRLIAAGYEALYYPNQGGVFISSDSGRTWRSAAGCGPLYWGISVACSRDGTKLFVASGASQAANWIYTSTDSGITWEPAAGPAKIWSSIACSADGSRAVAGVWNGTIYAWEAATTLTMALRGTNFDLSWPALSASDGLALQESHDLNLTNWSSVPETVAYTNAQYRVTLSLQSGNAFYRLKRP